MSLKEQLDMIDAQKDAQRFPRQRQPLPADPEPSEMTPRKCDECGQVDAYLPIIFNGRDLGADLPFHCAECAEKAEALERRKAEALAVAERKDLWEATIPAEYRATDLQHPAFDLATWESLRGHPYQTRNLGLVGTPGKCKTRFLALFAKRAINAGLTVGWANTFDLEDAARRRTNHRHADDAVREITHWKKARLLFLDDLGKSRWTPSLEALLFEILEARYSAQLVTHWSLNPQPEDAQSAITTEVLSDALDPEAKAAGRNHFAPILSRLQSNTLVVPV